MSIPPFPNEREYDLSLSKIMPIISHQKLTELSLSDLKREASKLGINKVAGDKRKKETWIRAIELATELIKKSNQCAKGSNYITHNQVTPPKKSVFDPEKDVLNSAHTSIDGYFCSKYRHLLEYFGKPLEYSQWASKYQTVNELSWMVLLAELPPPVIVGSGSEVALEDTVFCSLRSLGGGERQVDAMAYLSRIMPFLVSFNSFSGRAGNGMKIVFTESNSLVSRLLSETYNIQFDAYHQDAYVGRYRQSYDDKFLALDCCLKSQIFDLEIEAQEFIFNSYFDLLVS